MNIPTAEGAHGAIPSPVWLAAAWATISAAANAGRLGHSPLLVGAVGLGKTALAERLGRRLLCSTPDTASSDGCGRCRSCRLLANGSHPDFCRVTLEINEKTSRLRSEISVEQTRRLTQWLSLTAQFGGAQVALIEPADLLNRAAANALLKTLEEPLPGRYLMLVTAHPERLPQTIRSRCQRIDIRLPTLAESRDWLHQQLASGDEDHGESIDDGQIERALAAAEGNPAGALSYLREGELALRDSVRSDLAALTAGPVAPLSIAERWAQDRPARRLEFAAALARDIGLTQFNAERPGDSLPSGLTAGGDFPKLAAWFNASNRARRLLDAPLRVDLLLTDLLQQWCQATSR